MIDIERLYARQNGKVIGKIEAILIFFDDLEKSDIKKRLREVLKSDKKFDKKMKEMRENL